MANEKINYIELPATDMAGTRQFFTRVFGWEFIDYGPDYMALAGAGLAAAGFSLRTQVATSLPCGQSKKGEKV